MYTFFVYTLLYIGLIYSLCNPFSSGDFRMHKEWKGPTAQQQLQASDSQFLHYPLHKTTMWCSFHAHFFSVPLAFSAANISSSSFFLFALGWMRCAQCLFYCTPALHITHRTQPTAFLPFTLAVRVRCCGWHCVRSAHSLLLQQS